MLGLASIFGVILQLKIQGCILSLKYNKGNSDNSRGGGKVDKLISVVAQATFRYARAGESPGKTGEQTGEEGRDIPGRTNSQWETTTFPHRFPTLIQDFS
jgi:hypothetical protein